MDYRDPVTRLPTLWQPSYAEIYAWMSSQRRKGAVPRVESHVQHQNSYVRPKNIEKFDLTTLWGLCLDIKTPKERKKQVRFDLPDGTRAGIEAASTATEPTPQHSQFEPPRRKPLHSLPVKSTSLPAPPQEEKFPKLKNMALSSSSHTSQKVSKTKNMAPRRSASSSRAEDAIRRSRIPLGAKNPNVMMESRQARLGPNRMAMMTREMFVRRYDEGADSEGTISDEETESEDNFEDRIPVVR